MKSENIFINISKSFSALYIIVVKFEKVNTHLFFPSVHFVYSLLAKVGRTQVLPLSTDNSICPMKRCSAADDPDLAANFFKRNTNNENH
jgi:hypothetical protein